MKPCQWICRNCQKRLVVIRRYDEKIELYGCFGRNGYVDFIRDRKDSSIIGKIFALDSKTGYFINPFEEFKDLFGNPYVEKKTVKISDREFFKLITEYGNCQMFPEMEMTDWNRKR